MLPASIRPASRALVALLLAAPGLGSAQDRDGGSAEIFRRYADRVVKIQVVETGSGAKSTVGTGFSVSPDGHLITNYHVIARAVDAPERYRAEWIRQDGRARPAEILAIDVVHDLAVVAGGAATLPYFPLAPVRLAKGARLYSLGHPEDLGLAIVEGTYNGNLEHTLYPKAHFTGPLNPGMSGGPALTAEGRVAGVNVATAGNSVSFLVPIEAAIRLADRAALGGIESPDLRAEAGRQMLASQDRYLSMLFRGIGATVRLGPFELPTEPAEFFRCWADAERDPDLPFERIDHQCSTDDYIYLSGDQSSGIVSLEHRVLLSRGLNPSRFYALYSAQFARSANVERLDASEGVTPFRCRADNVRRDGILLRVLFCVRRYQKLDGLYDARIMAAVLGARDAGLITELSLAGVSFANAERVARQFVSRIKWTGR